MADDQRIRPTVQGHARLLQAVAAVAPAHVIDPGALGEYAQLVAERGRPHADRHAPDVAAHLATGCAACADDLRELVELARDEEAVSADDDIEVAARAPLWDSRQAGAERSQIVDDSGIHLRDLPDPRAAEADIQRRNQQRKWRERLLIAAAVAVLLMGLSLIGLAYLASGPRETPRLELAPQPAATAVQPAPAVTPGQPAPATQPGSSGQPAAPTSAGFAPPTGGNCPPTHPIKGNRNSGIYHAPGGSLYEATRPEQCFAQPSDAEAAGYRRSQR